MPEILGSTTHAKQAMGFNVSLLKGGTITQTIIGAIITGLVIASTIATIILVSVGVGYSRPVANPDTATTFKRVAITLDVLSNDRDLRGGNLTLTQIVVPPSHGTAKIASNSKIIYQSNGAFSGNDTFSYEVTNSYMTANATVTVQVLNRAPEAVPITKTVSKNVKNSLIDIFNFIGDGEEKISDPDSDILYAISYSGRQILSGNTELGLGSISIDPYNGYLYTPVEGFNGVEQFNYTISDGNDTSTSTITLTIANDPPIAVDDVYNLPKYGSLVLNVLSNDYDINGDDFNITSALGTGYGAIKVGEKSVTYITSSTINTKYSDSFEYTISDGQSEGSAIVIVNVYNTAPTVYSKTVTVAKSSLNNLVSVDYNDPDRKDLVTLTRVSPALSSLSPVSTLSLTTTKQSIFFECCDWLNVETNNYTINFTPVSGMVYTQSFTVTMTDSESEGTGVITINVVNTPPVAVEDSTECNKNQQVLINVVANDYDDNNGDTALIQLSSVGWTSATTQGGSVSIYNSTHVLYVAPKNYLGDDVATYAITDQSRDSAGNPDSTSYSKGTIKIKVINNPPTPADDSITISKGIVSILNVLDNDSDPNDGDSSVYTINSVTASSIKNILAIKIQNSGSKDTLSYTANNEEYTDLLTYDVTDQDGLISTYKATVTLNVVNNAPVAADDSYSTKWNRSVECSVKDNDSDLNGDLTKSTISITSNPSNGVASVVGNKITYTPTNGFVGTDSFNYKLNDGSSLNADSNSATVTVTVTNSAPITADDSATSHWKNPNGVLISPLSNDSDQDGDTLIVASASADSSVGTVQVVDAATVKFVPNVASATTGTKQFTYYASDYNKQTVGTVNVQITNTKPVANSDSYTLHWANPSYSLPVLSNDNDADNDDLSVGSVSGSTAAVNSGSSITYTAKKDGVTDIFQYTATDSVTSSDATTVTVTFTNNAQPSVTDSSTSVHWRAFASQSNQQDFAVLSSNTDADGDSLSLTVGATSTGISGSSCLKTDDSIPKVRVSAPTKTIGSVSCSYSVSDGLASSSATTTLTITNNVPVCTDITVSFNPTYITNGQSFSIGSSVSDADTNDASVLVPGSAIIVGSTYSDDLFQVSGSNILFKPMNQIGDRNYAYTVTDGVSTSTQCAFKILVSSVSPTDYSQSFYVHWAATSAPLDILAKLTTSTISRLGSIAASGTATITSGALYFTPLRKIYVDTFTVIVSAGGIESTVTVTVTTHNVVPTASLATQIINWGTSKTIDLLTNYADADYTNSLESMGTVTNIDKTSLSTKGTVSSLSGSSVAYTAPSNYVGSDSFKVTVSDGLATATFTVTFNMVNTAPVTNTKYFNVHWATHKTGYSMNLATGVTDAEGNTLTYSVTPSSISPTTSGSVAMGTSPNAIATAGSSVYLGKFTFTYSASDSIASTSGSVQVTVYNNMSTPVADSKDVHWKATGITLSPFAKFASSLKDADGDNLSFVSASAQKGTVTTGTTSLTYNAPANSVGQDVVTYKFTDGAESLQNSATIVNINLYNTAPRAIDKTASGKWNAVVAVDLTSSCTDDDSLDTATFNGAVTSTVGGSTSVSGKVVTYTPTTSLTYSGSSGVYTATGSFKFQCTDGLATATNPGTVTLTITNNAPTGTGNSVSINRDYTKTTYDFTWADIATVSDADGDSISYINFVSSDSAITVSNIVTGIRLTTTNKLLLGEKTISFKLNDGLHDSVSTLNFKVTFVNSAPVCAANSVSLYKKGVVDLSTLFSATDSNNDPITYALASSISTDFGSTSGTTFTASSTRSGSTSVTYTATDSQSTSTACTILVTINNRAPVADDASFQVVPVASSLIHTFNYVATDADSDTLTYAATSDDCTSQSLSTSLAISTAGVITFTRKSTAVSGSCKLYLTVTDNNQLTNAQDTATITFVISSTSPAANDDRFEINQGQTIRIYATQILANDFDEFGSTSTLTLTSISCPDSTYCHKTPRQVTVNGLPAVELDSDTTTCQADKFRYTMTTGLGVTKSADVYIEFKNCYCTAKIDFVFLLDSSGSIGSSNFNSMRDLAKRITGRMKVADDAIKISVVKFHDNGTLALPLSSDGTLVNNTLTNMAYEAGSTAQVPGLRVAIDALRPANGGRADADKVIYILTDGLANVPCSCRSCRNEWQAKPSVFYDSVQLNILGKYTGSALSTQLEGLCAYKYTDTSVLNGKTCSYCSGDNTAYCLPCADAVPIATKINTWKRNSSGVVPADPDNPYNGNNNVQWKIVAMAVGNAMSNTWGARQIQGMNYDSTRALTVSWTDLSSTMSEIVDQSCNQVSTTVTA